MREIVAFLYSDAFRAAEVMASLHRLRPDTGLDLDDAVCVTCDAMGKLKLHFAQRSAPGASDVRFWQRLIGPLVTQTPERDPEGVAGGNRLGDITDDAFIGAVRAQLTPGTSAVFVLVRDVTRDNLVPHVSAFGGTPLRAALSCEAVPRSDSSGWGPTPAPSWSS